MPRGFMSRTTEVSGRAVDPPVIGSLLYYVNASDTVDDKCVDEDDDPASELVRANQDSSG